MASKKAKKRRSISITKGKTPNKKFKQKSRKALKSELKAASFKEKRSNDLKPLYTFHRAKPDDPMSRKIFDRKPSDMSMTEIRKLVKGVNDRLYKLEKAGKQMESKTYQTIAKYAAENQLNMYNINPDTGAIRVTQDLGRFPTAEARYQYIRRLQEILSNETSTVGGTNRAMKKAYNSFMKNPKVMQPDASGKLKPINLSFNEYKKIWKTYKSNVEPDENGKYESDTVIDFIQATREMGYEDIPESSLAKTFAYYEQEKDGYADMYSFLINNPNVFSDI